MCAEPETTNSQALLAEVRFSVLMIVAPQLQQQFLTDWNPHFNIERF
jgi:hypothetical protein